MERKPSPSSYTAAAASKSQREAFYLLPQQRKTAIGAHRHVAQKVSCVQFSSVRLPHAQVACVARAVHLCARGRGVVQFPRLCPPMFVGEEGGGERERERWVQNGAAGKSFQACV